MIEFIALSLVFSLFYLLVFSRERIASIISSPVLSSSKHR
jgi:hypothetical protein